MTESAQDRIKSALGKIENDQGVTILYACESGSRAWGFESEDSDYDVRFFYLRPTAWYLSIQKKSDVIEIPPSGDLDISGWDVPKALELLRKSNPPLLEWLQSPVVYCQKSSFVERLRGLMADYYSPVACMYHYLSMAQNNFRKYLKEEQVLVKKYFYVLRPVLACLWIERGLGVVPMEFSRLVDRVVEDGPLKDEIGLLLKAKIGGAELDRGPRNQVISDFLEQELQRLEARTQLPPKTQDPARLDRLFVQILREVNGGGLE
jgi:predicted nucleotidyltransferase